MTGRHPVDRLGAPIVDPRHQGAEVVVSQEAPRRADTLNLIILLRVVLVVVVLLMALIGIVAGSLITDACPLDGTCSPVELRALGHLPLQMTIGITGLLGLPV